MLPNRSSAFFVPSLRYSVELGMVLPIFYESHQIFFPDFVAPGFLPRINARQLSAFQIIECCSFAAMAKQAHLFLSQNIRHFRPINVIDFHNIHLCHLFGGRHLCMLCCSNIVLTFLTRILTKLPKSAHFWLSFEPPEKSSFFQGWMPKHLDTAMVLGGQNSLKAIRKNHKSHNGWKDSKSVWEHSHEGSNPSRCAKKRQGSS